VPQAPKDPWSALGAEWEQPSAAAAAAQAPVRTPIQQQIAQGQQEGWMPRGRSTPQAPVPAAVVQAPSPANPRPPTEPMLPPAPHGATVEASSPTMLDAARLSIANSAIGHALQAGMPGVASALHLEPTEVPGSAEYQQHGQQLINPQPLVEMPTQAQAQAALDALHIATGGVPMPLPPGTMRETPGGAKTPVQQVATGAAAGLGGLTTPGNLALMAVPIGEVAGMTGKAGAAIIPRLVSAGFTAQMIRGLYQQAQAYRQAKADGHDDEAEQILGEMMVTAPMLFAAGAHAAFGGHAAPGEAGKEEAAPAETRELAPQAPVKPGKAPDAFEALGGEYEQPAGVPRGTEEHPPIGAVEPETERPVLQQSPRPEVNQAAATAEHPAVKQTLEKITQPIEGAEVVGARPEKDSDRLEEKMEEEGQSPRTVRDYSGFRIAVDSPQARDQVVAALRNQFEIPNESDEFEKGAEETGFHGHTLQVREPGSPVSHEVQVLPREVAEVADDRHALYEKAREGDADAMARLKATNEADYQKFVERQGASQPEGEGARETKFKFGSTQANIPEDSDAAQAVKGLQQKIAPEDRGGDVNDAKGGIVPQPHVTVRYGIQGDDIEGIRRYLEQQAPFEATLGRTEKFPVTDSSEGTAPIVAPVEAPELHRIEAELEGHGDFAERTFPEYKPHATVAYVKPEAADKYVGLADTEGKRFQVNSISISDRNGNQIEVPLKGEPNAVPERSAGGVLQRPQEEAGAGGGGRGRVEPGERGPEVAGARGFFGNGQEEGAGTAGAPQIRPAAEVKPNEVARVPVGELNADPRRFQYKMSATSEAGTTDLLKGHKWNDALAGVISVWRDPDDGKVYVVNGHHRYELAVSSAVPHMNVLMIDAPDAATARSIGALQNIAEGRGTPMDAARFFRDSGYTPERLDSLGVSMGEATAANGVALARLDQRLFDDVVSGKLRQNRAIAIGKATDKPEEQEAILKLIEQAERRGRHVSDDTVDELARMAKGAGTHTETQETLFGAQEMTRNLALEKAEVSSYIRDQIGQEKRLFGSVADETKAGRLKAGGNTINASKNRAIAESARQAQELYDRLSTRAGDVDDILSRAARDLAQGKEAPNAIKQRSYEQVRAALSKAVGEPAGGQPRGIREGAAGAQRPAELPAAAQRSQGLRPPAPPERAAAPAARWEKGERFLVRDPATGNYRAGEVSYFNEGINGAKAGGRSRIGDAKLDEIPRDALRILTTEKPLKGISGTGAEKEMIERTKQNLPKYTADYLEGNTREGVPTLATDAAKELFPEFKADPTGNDRDLAAAAKAIRDSALKTVLAEPVDPRRRDVLITTASPGSGKTFSQIGLGAGGIDPIGIKIEAISDDYKSFASLVRQVADSGRRPVINWIFVDEPAKTVDRMFLRAIGHDDRPGIGRTVQLKYMATAYAEVPRVIDRIRQEFGDRVAIRVTDNSGPVGSAGVTDDIDPYLERARQMPYNQVLEEMNAEVERLREQGLFESERGKAVLKAAQANDPVTSSEGGSGSANAGAAAPGGQRGAAAPEQPEVPGTVLGARAPSAVEPPQPTEGVSVSPEKFLEGLKAARTRSLRENAAVQQARAVDLPHLGKAVVMDPDAMGVWYRSGLGDTRWRGMSLPRNLANKLELMLRSMAGSARTEPGGAEAAAGYDRLVQAMRDGRNADGSLTILRGDFRPDTVLEEAWHRWQRANRMEDSDAIRAIAQRPEVRETADRLREMGYGLKPGVEGRSELAMEMMAKALAGDPDLHMSADQRFDLVHEFLSQAAREYGPQVLDQMPGVTPEAEAAVREARRSYAPDEEGRGGAARGPGETVGAVAAQRSGVGERARAAGGEGQSAPAGNESGTGEPGAPEDQLARFQRAPDAKVGDVGVSEPSDSEEGPGWKAFYARLREQRTPQEVRRLWGYDKEGMSEPYWKSAGRMILSPEKDGSWAVRLVQSTDEGKGVATALYKQAIDYVRSQGGTELTSDPEGGSKDSVAGIWKKLGAVETPGVGEGKGAVRWRLDLTKGAEQPLFQRAKGLRPEDSLALPGMENVDQERGGEAQDQLNFQRAGKSPEPEGIIKDEKGVPLVVYHGTMRDFDRFDAAQRAAAPRGRNAVPGDKEANKAFWFAESRRAAEFFANGARTPRGVLYPGARLISANISLKNPLVVDLESPEWTPSIEDKPWRTEELEDDGVTPTGRKINQIRSIKERAVRRALRNGNDGVIFENGYDFRPYKGRVFAVFSPDDIRPLEETRGGQPKADGSGQEPDIRRALFQRDRGLRPEDSFALPGMENVDQERAAARGETEAQLLSDELRRPLADISGAAGRMERESPLFKGQGDFPTLFQKTANEENPVSRSVQDLIDSFAREPRADNRTALQKVSDWGGRVYDESTGRAANYVRQVPSKLEGAWAQAKSITAALVDGFRNPLKATDWKASIGQADLARAETALKLQKLSRELKDRVPDRLARIGMTHFIEAGGDPRTLAAWSLAADQRWQWRRGDPDISPALKDHYADAVGHYKAALNLTPEQKALATRIKQHFDDLLKIAKDNGMLEYGARNYVRHLYEKADAANLVHLLDTNELDPNPGFLEKRVFQTYFDAENAGMIPRNKDVGYLLGAYDKSFNSALASRNMLRSLLYGKGDDGRPLAAIRLRGKWISVDDTQKPLVLEQRERPKSLAGYKYLDHAPARNFLFEPTREDLDGYEYDPKLFEEDPSRLAFKGDLIFHPDIAGRVDDMLTPGWFDRNETPAQKVGHAILTGSSAAKEMMTMMAPFHLVQLGEHSIEHWVNPLKLPEIDLSGKGESSRVQRLLASNGLGLMDFDAEGLFSARALKGLSEGVPGLNVAMEGVDSLSRWQFEDIIPRLKMKNGVEWFNRNWDRYGDRIEAEELSRLRGVDRTDTGEGALQKMAHERAQRMVAEMTAKQVNAGFGNLNTAFDSVHRSKTFKQLLRLTLFAPDFLESRIRYTGQAFTRYGGEQRMALLRGALGMWLLARAGNAVFNKGDTKDDLEHAFTIVAGGRNFSLRSQEGDILHLITDPRGFIYNRLNPLTTTPTIEFLSGRDQMGRQKTFASQIKDYAKRPLPFGVQKIIQTPDEGILNSLLSSAGVITSNYRSPAEEMTHKLYLKSLPDLPDDPEKQAQSRGYHQLEEALRQGKKKPGDVIDQAKEGKMTLREAWNIIDRSGHSELYNEFVSGGVSIVPKHAGDPSALDIYAKASPAERMELRPALIEKGENQLPEIRREAPASRAQISALEKEWDEQEKADPTFKRPAKVPDGQFDVLAARWRALLASTPHEEGVPGVPEKGTVATK